MKNIFLTLIIIVSLFSCSKKFEDMNKNKKSPEKVNGVTLFTNAQRNLADQLSSTNVNTNVWKLFAQYWTETTYNDEANYDIQNRSIPDNAWRTLYRDVLMDLKEAKNIITTEEYTLASDKAAKQNRLLIADILSVYTYNRLVDMFGDIPYSESLDIDNPQPIYDNAQDIYNELLVVLEAAIVGLDATQGSYDNADMFYNGDVEKWIKFANSLKLKMGLHLIDVNPAKSKTLIEAAAENVFTSSDDNATFAYLSATPNTNPLYLDLVASGRHDFVATNTMIDILVPLNDPRIDDFYSLNGHETYKGGPYGDNNAYDDWTVIGKKLEDPTFKSVILDYTEVMFYLAEAASNGFSVGATAEEYYVNGITSSILYWGGTEAEVNAYLTQTDVAYSKEKIGTQEWIAFFNRGFLGWTTWRRLATPVLNKPVVSGNEVPVRFTYPIGEQTLNNANYTSAASAIGGDNLYTKLFWDKY